MSIGRVTLLTKELGKPMKMLVSPENLSTLWYDFGNDSLMPKRQPALAPIPHRMVANLSGNARLETPLTTA
jgi:hypothetical protein